MRSNDIAKLLECLSCLVGHNVIGPAQYFNRYKGFVAELEFVSWLRARKPGALLQSGGMFLPLDRGSDSFKNSFYFVVQSDDSSFAWIAEYSESLLQLAKRGIFLFTYDKEEPFDSWGEFKIISIEGPIFLPLPNSFKVSRYCQLSNSFVKSSINEFMELNQLVAMFKAMPNLDIGVVQHFKSILSSYCYQDLTELYLTRLVLDGLCGIPNGRGAPLDIDFVYKPVGSSEMYAIEVKDKDRSKSGARGFGMDLRRIDSFSTILQSLQMKGIYAVRHVSDQTNRTFIEWCAIWFSKFKLCTEDAQIQQGGHGMGHEKGRYPTVVCPYEQFTRYD